MFQNGMEALAEVFRRPGPSRPEICSLRRFIFARLSNWPRLCPRQRCCASVLQRRAARHFRSLTASRAWTQMGSIFTLGSALWTRCPLLLSRSAQLCWRSSACGLLHSFFLDRRKRISGRTWICSAVSPTHCAPSLCIAFAPTLGAGQGQFGTSACACCLCRCRRIFVGLAMDGCRARARLSWRYWPLVWVR